MRVVRRNVILCPFMNILIEDAETLEFLDGTGKWTKDATRGKCFAETPLAVQAAKQEPIGRFNIVFYSPETKQLFNLDHGRGKGPVPA
jgi:hypothetical protein